MPTQSLLVGGISLPAGTGCCCGDSTCEFICELLGCVTVGDFPALSEGFGNHCECLGGGISLTGRMIGEDFSDIISADTPARACGAWLKWCHAQDGGSFYNWEVAVKAYCNSDGKIQIDVYAGLPLFGFVFGVGAYWRIITDLTTTPINQTFTLDLIESDPAGWPADCGVPPATITVSFDETCSSACAKYTYVTVTRDAHCDPWTPTVHTPDGCDCDAVLSYYFPSENPTLLCFDITCTDDSTSTFCTSIDPLVGCTCDGFSDCSDFPDASLDLNGFTNFDQTLFDDVRGVSFIRHWTLTNLNRLYELPYSGGGLEWDIQLATSADYTDPGKIAVFWDEYGAPFADVLYEGYVDLIQEFLNCDLGHVTISAINLEVQTYTGLHSGGTPVFDTVASGAGVDPPTSPVTIQQGQAANCFSSTAVAEILFQDLMTTGAGDSSHSYIAVTSVGSLVV